jgi:hypothetical protein
LSEEGMDLVEREVAERGEGKEAVETAVVATVAAREVKVRI